MSDVLGPINFGDARSQPFMGMSQTEGHKQHYSEATAQQIDQEVHAIIERNFKLAQKILAEKKQSLIRLAEALVLWETLDGQQVEDIVAGRDIGSPVIVSPKQVSGSGRKKTRKKAKKSGTKVGSKIDPPVDIDDGVTA